MKNLALIFCLLMSWAQTGISADAEAGKAMSLVCSGCHGADGNSMVPIFPKLSGQGEVYLLKQLRDIRDGARPIATMVGLLDGKSDEDLANIAAFYAAQEISRGKTDPELLEQGQKIFRAGIAMRQIPACSACHSPTGQGNGPAGFPALAGQHAEYTAAQLEMYRKGYDDESGRTNDGDGRIMRIIAFGLSDKEIKAVSSYTAGLQ